MWKMVQSSKWQEPLFRDFVNLSKIQNQDNPYYLGFRLGDLKKIFGPDQLFERNNHWMAIGAYNGSRLEGFLIVSKQKDYDVGFACVGYFECKNDTKLSNRLFELAQNWAKNMGVLKIKGPMEGHFFRGYRYRLPSVNKPFYGEGLCPKYYFDLFEAAGFSICGKWKSHLAKFDQTLDKANQIIQKFKTLGPESELVVRRFDLKNWNTELKILHQLFMVSYNKMADFMPISFKEFKEIYGPFKYLAHPDLSFFIEYKGQPVAFLVSYYDPLNILIKYKKSKNPLKFFIMLSQLKKNKTKLLVPYVGKLPEADSIKGLAARLISELIFGLQKQKEDYVACYLAEGSPSYKTLPAESEVVSEYVLFEKVFS